MPGVVVPLSISAGGAVFPHDGDSYETLLAAADRRMYGDKSKRRREIPRHHEPVLRALSGSTYDITPV